MTQPVLSLVGPTAVGKTATSLWLAEQLLADEALSLTGVDLIVADSRQVYQGLEVVSGADVPVEFVPDQVSLSSALLPASLRVYRRDHITLWGVSCVQPTQEWSLNHFRALAHHVLEQAQANNRLVLIVGGTGLYHQYLTTQDVRLDVPPNERLREKAAELSLEELQTWLQQVDSTKWEIMNHSDRHNPRRLVRALELAEATTQVQPATSLAEMPIVRQLWAGLQLDLSIIETRIADRVRERWQGGAVAEVERLLSTFGDQGNQAFLNRSVATATGVKEVAAYLNGELLVETCQQLWARRELQYVKRQLTWWKKQPEITWFNVAEADYQSKLLAWLRPELLY